jgi:ActR/RegA family two-component response regulator
MSVTFGIEVGPIADDWPTARVVHMRYIQRVIVRHNGNKTKAAETLGIDRRTLNRILARERAKANADATKGARA